MCVSLCFKALSFNCLSFCLWFCTTPVLSCLQGGVPPPGFWSAIGPGLRSRRLLTAASVGLWVPCQSRACWGGMRGQPCSTPSLIITRTLNPPQNFTPNPPRSTTNTPTPTCTLFIHNKKAGRWNWIGGHYPSTLGMWAPVKPGRPGLPLWTWLALTQRLFALEHWRTRGGAAVP